MRIRGAELVVKALEAEGVRFTFGIPGTHNTELYDALERSPVVRPVLVTSELAAAFLADGISRTTAQTGVLTVVPGAGVTHALSGIAEAFMDTVPMVVLACGIRSDTGAAYQLHAIDQLAVLRPVTKAAWRVEHVDAIVPRVREAFRLARSGTPGPVAVEIPADLMLLTHDATRPEARPPAPGAAEPAPELVEEAARRLAAARRPGLYVGLGAAGAAEWLPELAERLGAPVATTISGKGVFPETHPLWVWPGFGPQAPRFAAEVMGECDCLLAIGCRFSEVATGSYGLTPPANLIHVDTAPEVFHRNFKAAVAVESDAERFVRALLALLGGEARDRRDLEQAIAAGHRKVEETWAKEISRKGVTPARLLATLQRHCGPDTVYSTDSGNGTFLAMEHLRLDRPGCFIGPVDFSCMGYSVPAAVGASLASPARDVVALAGDGALLMTGLELIAGGAAGATPVVVVLRDGRLGQIAQFQRIPLNRETCTVLPPFDVEDLARATRCSYFRVLTDAELEPVVPLALEAARGGRPVMVEVAIDYSRKTFFTRGVVKTNFWRLPWGDRLRMLGRALGRRVVPGGEDRP